MRLGVKLEAQSSVLWTVTHCGGGTGKTLLLNECRGSGAQLTETEDQPYVIRSYNFLKEKILKPNKWKDDYNYRCYFLVSYMVEIKCFIDSI